MGRKEGGPPLEERRSISGQNAVGSVQETGRNDPGSPSSQGSAGLRFV
ncbi:rCG52021 [Rattus norvegicus]|uniref:RCG52021 n=1 Tax=Rattus norvegicus TaxID=10116 RepID=A6K3B9_RAT|nr:rCG52021 [Rattus norvegicus]